MKIKQAKYDYTEVGNIRIYNYVPIFYQLKKELKNLRLELVWKLTPSDRGPDTLESFAFFDHKNQQENIINILKDIAKISESELILNFDDEDITVTIYDDYIE